ncbi:MAG: hypothetical protein LBR08_01610 [Bacteroidales bacterium]|jgi:hypothetical protein|nr:hypothetical protein [Bacteroidales bacterium]
MPTDFGIGLKCTPFDALSSFINYFMYLCSMKRFVLLVLTLVPVSCGKKTPQPLSFYYWKTVFRCDGVLQRVRSEDGVRRLYVRYFDVIAGEGGAKPEATVIFGDSIPEGIQTVPVVFIVNKALEMTTEDSIPRLAAKICARMENIHRHRHARDVPEIQADCDWNASTRDKYFHLLRCMRGEKLLQGRQLSVTLRLHQWKYRKSAGIPPVDRVMLMCYNMGGLTTYGNHNSILDAEETRAYMQHAGVYPLPADVALPLFHWGVRFSNMQYRGLIGGLRREDLQTPHFRETAPRLYCCDTSLLLRGVYVGKGEHIRLEEPSVADLRKTAKILSSCMKNPENIVWYHLDSLLLQKIPTHELQEIADLFR